MNEPTGAQLETVIIFTSQMETLAAFYQEALGIGLYQPSPGHLGCRVGDVYFGFDQVEAIYQQTHQSTGPTLWVTVADLQVTPSTGWCRWAQRSSIRPHASRGALSWPWSTTPMVTCWASRRTTGSSYAKALEDH